MKKLVTVLLVILIVASCCALSACQESCDKRGYHNYVSYKCKDCGATRCIEEDHKWIIGEDGKPVFTQCVYCNAADCDRGDHSYVKGECTKCGKTNCDKGFHAFEEGMQSIISTKGLRPCLCTRPRFCLIRFTIGST